MSDKIVIIGAGQAGSALAAKLRTLGHEGPITLIGEEPFPPYQRPPLSKKYLLGEMEVERLYLRPAEYYTDQKIDLMTGTSVSGIDRAARTVALSDGRVIEYDRLALTTGSRPRLLPAAIGGALGGVYAVRGLSDVDAMAGAFLAGSRVLIVGGGYIGLEAAAVAAARGLSVVLVEMADRILQRVASAATSDFFRALHQRHGVDIREGTGLTRLLGDSHVTGAILSDGSALDIDFALVGVGILANDRLAADAGLDTSDGIIVDAAARTADPAIWAAGDCAILPYQGRLIRLESVQNAIDQAEAAAASMLGHDVTYQPVPWFWSDQYDVKLQIAGLSQGHDSMVRREGAGGAVSIWYYQGDRLLAVDAMNDPRAYMVGKRLIEDGISPSRADVANPATDPKALLKVRV